MGVLVLLSAVAALAFPEVFGQVKPTVINPLLGVIMFGMGLTLKADDFRIVFSRPKDVIIGCLAQFTVMPLLAWALAKTPQKLYVGRRFHNDVLIIDLNSGNVEEKTIPLVREPTTMVLSPDEKALYVGNALTAGPANSVNVATSISQISLVDKREAARASGRGYASETAGFGATRVQSGTDIVGSSRTASGAAGMGRLHQRTEGKSVSELDELVRSR